MLLRFDALRVELLFWLLDRLVLFAELLVAALVPLPLAVAGRLLVVVVLAVVVVLVGVVAIALPIPRAMTDALAKRILRMLFSKLL